MKRAMFATVLEIGRVATAEAWDINWKQGGTIVLARTPLQLASAREEIANLRSWGFGEEDYALLDAKAAKTKRTRPMSLVRHSPALRGDQPGVIGAQFGSAPSLPWAPSFLRIRRQRQSSLASCGHRADRCALKSSCALPRVTLHPRRAKTHPGTGLLTDACDRTT